MQLFSSILLAGVVWFVSFFGMAMIIAKNWSALLVLPERRMASRAHTNGPVKTGVIPIRLLSVVSFERILRKSLLKVHIVILKAENKTAALLEHLRRKSENREGSATVRRQDGYWENLKKTKKR